MSAFKKVLASVGIGAAKVDTKVRQRYITQGESLEGIVEIRGGETEQKIATIHLNLMTVYGQEGSDRLLSTTIYSHKVNEPFTISKGEIKDIPFSFRIPLDTPITMQDPKTGQNVPPVWIHTDVDIQNAVDLKDQDHISIDPTTVHEQIISAIKGIGFKFRQMENQTVPRGIKIARPFIQQFEFIPAYGKYLRKLDELAVYIVQNEQDTTIFFEVDKKGKGAFAEIKEKLNLDEHRGSVTFNNENIINQRGLVSEKFDQIIENIL